MSYLEFGPDNVIVVGFAEDDRAYEALTTLKQLATQGQIGLDQAAAASPTSRARRVAHRPRRDRLRRRSRAGARQ